MKNSFICMLVVTFVCNTAAFSQVGIGTTSPNSSSMLDITSNSKGFLMPRMATSDRTSISSPAEGLQVYDTTEDAIYYYDGSAWVKLSNSTTNERVNYKLIKSASDLSDELTAGGGTKYLLTSNTYYEINGSITLAAPIDLNDAYISGLDANEDRLVIAGGTIFNGSTGGSIRNLTLVAINGTIFNVTGSGTETLIFQNCIVSGFDATTDSFGSISNYNIVFFNIINIGNLDSGITYSNINNLLLSNVAWFDSNAGTFETYTGSFDLIERVSGFFKVPSGATGIDVSADPTVGSGNIISTPFSGAGTFINGYTTGTYTGYFFDDSWDIDSPGIPKESDDESKGYYYMTGNSTTTTFVSNDVPVKIGGTTTSNNLFRTASTNNRLTYEGKEGREFQILCTGTLNHSVSMTPNARIYEFYIYKNGVQVSAISSERRFSKNDIGNFTLIGLIDLEPTDYIEVWVSVNNASNVTGIIERLSVVLQ